MIVKLYFPTSLCFFVYKFVILFYIFTFIKSRINSSQMRFQRSLSGVTLGNRFKSENIWKKWKVEEIIDDIKIINRNGTNMFLGCQKIYYRANHCNINHKGKEILKVLNVVGKTSSCSCRTGIDYPKLGMEKEDDFLFVCQSHENY